MPTTGVIVDIKLKTNIDTNQIGSLSWVQFLVYYLMGRRNNPRNRGAVIIPKEIRGVVTIPENYPGTVISPKKQRNNPRKLYRYSNNPRKLSRYSNNPRKAT
jgi:hypothetical protein